MALEYVSAEKATLHNILRLASAFARLMACDFAEFRR